MHLKTNLLRIMMIQMIQKKIETKSKKNDAEKENSDDKNTINTSKIDNSEPKKDEKAEIKQELNDNITINIELNGSENIELKKGDTYKELGARATDSNGNDVSQKIIIDGKVDTSKEGEYIVIYSIGKSMVMRNIIVK